MLGLEALKGSLTHSTSGMLTVFINQNFLKRSTLALSSRPAQSHPSHHQDDA
jgi:hypothetical protein